MNKYVQSVQKVGSSKKFKVLYWHLLAKWGNQKPHSG